MIYYIYIIYIYIYICINIFVYIFTNLYIVKSPLYLSDKVIVTYFLLSILILYMKLGGNDDSI